MNFTAAILNEPKKCKTAFGNYSISIHDVDSENYENCEDIMTAINYEMRNLTTINIDNTEYKIDYYLGGDLKMILMNYGK